LILGLEAGIGVALLLAVRHIAVLAITTGMVTIFLFLTGRTYVRFLQGDLQEGAGCGCFGYLIERTPSEAFWTDLVLLLLPLVLLLWSARPYPRQLPRGRLAAAAAAAVAVMGLALWAPSLPLDDLATRLRPGVEVGALCVGSEPRVCLTEVAPDLAEGRHWVVISALDEALIGKVQALNQGLWGNDDAWQLSILTPESAGEVDKFRWTTGPAFGLVGDVPEALLAPLYRTLPRSFEVVDGRVVRTSTGWPPWLEREP
jgi:hypothetical protein